MIILLGKLLLIDFVFPITCLIVNYLIFSKYCVNNLLDTAANFDSMSRVVTQKRGQAF